MKTMRMAALVAVAGLALAGCAQNGDAAAPPPASGGSPVTDSPQEPTPTDAAQPASPPSTNPGGSGRPAPAGPTSLTGVVTSGVEPGCLLLDNYLLVGGPRERLRAGARVTVTGQVRADMMTTCQQGTPFVVEQVAPA